MFPLVYLGLALAGLVSAACNSTEKKPEMEMDPPISAEPPPRPQPPKLMISENEPAYGVYLQLKEAGLRIEQMDRVEKFGEVTDEDLLHAGRTFYQSGISIEKNKEWAEKIQNSFKDASDRYFDRGAEQNGITFPEVCKNLDLFKKAAFWNYNNEQAQFILGVCQPDRERLLHAIKLNPNYTQQGLENFYREATENKSQDAQAWKILGDALKIKGKEKEAKAAYQKAHELDPKLEIAQGK